MDQLNQGQTSPSQPNTQNTIIVVGKRKSVGTAFLLAFLFGPLGLLYASVTGAICMLIAGFILGVLTFGLGFIVAWIGSIIWAVIAANEANKVQASNFAQKRY